MIFNETMCESNEMNKQACLDNYKATSDRWTHVYLR